ncbi:MAG: alanyl-tRNA editing protein, partial [Gammaproteobacteria bacterium]|nr:alanyl-tRNA editing protein [Gammaproteobacteria bacterium]
MTEKIFYQDSYQKTHSSTVARVMGNSVVFESTIFYPLGGGQPGDTGKVSIGDKAYRIIDTRFDEDRSSIVHFLDTEDLSHIQTGEKVDMELDWQRRHRLMRMHTSMHLMCHLIPAQATGGSVGETESRIDFDLQGLEVDKEDLSQRM